ncbi:hypothetical protein J7K06_01070 [Candidatus Bathyarchaeota archaeon]|nr:hypothetical protein [Candidatus Bathyarchaeota archaeon]
MTGKVEELVEKLKCQVFAVLEDKPLSLKELYDLARIVKVLVELEAEVGGSEKEIRDFIEKIMRRVVLENEAGTGDIS